MDQACQRENTQNRKRTRDEGEGNIESKRGNRSEVSFVEGNTCKEKSHDFGDGVGVFDFPWLKEGVIYKGNDCFEEPEDTFAACSYVDEEVSSTFASNLDQSCMRNPHDQDLHYKKCDDESLWSLFQVDDLEPVDHCIWSSVIDQPLDVGLLNKAGLKI